MIKVFHINQTRVFCTHQYRKKKKKKKALSFSIDLNKRVDREQRTFTEINVCNHSTETIERKYLNKKKNKKRILSNKNYQILLKNFFAKKTNTIDLDENLNIKKFKFFIY